MTWGHCDYGGDSSVVQEQLYSVKHIQASQSAFAAILADQSVVTWGDEDCGGCSEPVKCQLKRCAADPSHSVRICCHSW